LLTLTSRALDVVQTVTGHPRLSPESGLRIDGATPPLQVRAASAPQPGDEVIERDGARLFLGGQARQRLRDRTLDVVTESSGRIHFLVRPRRAA
jgi:iron-sulfur cluster assembly protein